MKATHSRTRGPKTSTVLTNCSVEYLAQGKGSVKNHGGNVPMFSNLKFFLPNDVFAITNLFHIAK